MKKIRKIISLAGLALCLAVPGWPGSALAGTEVVVVVDTLNIHEAPNTQSAVIAKARKGQVYLAVDINDGWLTLSLPGGKFGYVSSQYALAKSVVDSMGLQEDEPCDGYATQYHLEINSKQLDCKKDLFGEGYRHCDLELGVSIQASCALDGTIEADCEAKFAYEDKHDILPRTKRVDKSEFLPMLGGFAQGTVTLTFKPLIVIEPVIRVSVKSLKCEPRFMF